MITLEKFQSQSLYPSDETLTTGFAFIVIVIAIVPRINVVVLLRASESGPGNLNIFFSKSAVFALSTSFFKTPISIFKSPLSLFYKYFI